VTRVLHLYANHKLTGPAELALETARALLARGVEASFYSSDVKRTEHRDRWLQRLAREREVPEPALKGVVLGKHHSPLQSYRDARKLADYLRERRPDLLHCHLPNDHLIGGKAAQRVAPPPLPIVRSLYDGEPPPVTRRARLTLGDMTDRLVCLSAEVAEFMRGNASDYGLDPAKVVHLPPPIDTERFNPARSLADRREALGVPEDAFCLGIVARMQTHRRYEVLLEAIRLARAEEPRLHMVVLGRGTNQETVGKGPVRELGLEGAVHFPGYVAGEDYVATLGSCDAKVFMVPGSDGTCRAVREALAMGLPVVATRRGMLPELVRDGVDGILVEETPESLSQAFLRLIRDAGTREAMAAAAREGAVERFAFSRYAERLESIYEDLLA
jgi:glycosyltransferase involved in cell wall biosynthesis